MVSEATRTPVPPLPRMRSLGFFDLKIYRQAAGVVIHGGRLYATTLHLGFGFTYPPFAALLFISLRGVSLFWDEVLVTALNVTLVVAIARLTLRLPTAPSADAGRRWPSGARMWLIAAGALWLEPVTTAIGYGQVDLLVTVLVLADVVCDSGSRWGGIRIGLAAAMKLTPLVFIPYLLLSRRGRSAVRAVTTFLVTIGVSLLLVPGDGLSYWGGAFLHTSRVTGGAGGGPANQSLRGALLRVAPGLTHQTPVWVLLCVAIGGLGLFLACRAASRGNEACGFALAAVTGLLVSPVSWTHHWTIAVPGLLAVIARPGRSATDHVAAAAAAVFSAGSWLIWLVIGGHPDGEHLGVGAFLLGDLYVMAGLGTIIISSALELRRVLDSRPQRGVPINPASRANWRPLRKRRSDAGKGRVSQKGGTHDLVS